MSFLNISSSYFELVVLDMSITKPTKAATATAQKAHRELDDSQTVHDRTVSDIF